MKYKLIKPLIEGYDTIQQILSNREIPEREFSHYLNTTDSDINSETLLGEDRLKKGVEMLMNAITNGKRILVIVDSDCDGYTSSALLLNFLYEYFPEYVTNNMDYFLHAGKEHGLKDCYELCASYDMVIAPDSSSNDYECHKFLANKGIPVLVLDHHEAEHISEDALVINNQLSDYPNKDLSGVGIVWQFCRYIDKIEGEEKADNFLDLVALGNCSDMMSLRSIETKHLMNKGFNQLKNPFFYYMAQKNSYSLGDQITPMGVAFYIVPFVNAMQRSGTQEEKDLLFRSMLQYKAFEEVPSTKRGHAPGEMETIVTQAVRTVVNVKNRQTRAQNSGIEYLENKIVEDNLLDHKVLLFLIKENVIDKNIAGLCANKFMAKYQRPCCILIEREIDGKVFYQGSARGYEKSGITNFKDVCVETGLTDYAEGHQNAFGLSIEKDNVKDFIEQTDLVFKDMSTEPIYLVDYIYEGEHVNPQNILDIANLKDIWGQGMDEALVAIKDLKITKTMITLMGLNKGKPTLKIALPNKVNLIKFGSSQEEYDNLCANGYVKIDIVGRCGANEWMGNINPQILIEDYDINKVMPYDF